MKNPNDIKDAELARVRLCRLLESKIESHMTLAKMYFDKGECNEGNKFVARADECKELLEGVE